MGDYIIEVPPFERYKGQESYFGGQPPLSESVGYCVVLGFGAFFSIVTTALVYMYQYFGKKGEVTSEHFNTAGRMMKTGLISSVIVSNWTWAATLLQSSNVAWQYGVSGPFWYASGATIQVLLFGVLAIRIKKIAPSAHTVCEIVKARWGRSAHATFLFFCFSSNIIVTSMLLLGGASVVEALTGMDYRRASFLIPWGIIVYTAVGGLQSTFVANYFHTAIIFAILVFMIFLVYIKHYSSDLIYDFLTKNAEMTTEECEAWYSDPTTNVTFFEKGKYACGSVPRNQNGSYLTMMSGDGLMFGIINIVGNFGTVFVDQSYWQSAIAARPESAARGYLLGGICWFAIPFSLATSLGLASAALMLPITSQEAGDGLVPPAVATFLMGQTGALLILIMLFMAIVSTGSAEAIAVSSLVAYDIYREYINPEATGRQILFVSRVVIIIFGLFMGCFSIVLYELHLNLGWVYLFMGIFIGSAVCPLWNMMTWKHASGEGAVMAAWGGFGLAMVAWVFAAKYQSDVITVDSLGTNEAMLSGNLVAILSSGFIHFIWSMFADPQDYNFDDLDQNIKLVEPDMRGLSAAEKNPKRLERAERWIKHRAYLLTLVLVVIWPLLTIPAGVFTQSYFSWWVTISILWSLGAAVAMFVMPISESQDDINMLVSELYYLVIRGEASTDQDSDDDDDEEMDRANDPASQRKRDHEYRHKGEKKTSVRQF